jgi:hypothetical protein
MLPSCVAAAGVAAAGLTVKVGIVGTPTVSSASAKLVELR